jgi:hypothetical protein
MKKIKLIHILLLIPISMILILVYMLALHGGVFGIYISILIVLITGIMILGEKIKNKEKVTNMK